MVFLVIFVLMQRNFLGRKGDGTHYSFRLSVFTISLTNRDDPNLSWLAVNISRSLLGNSSWRKGESGWCPQLNIKIWQAAQGNWVCPRLWLPLESSSCLVEKFPQGGHIWEQWLDMKLGTECSYFNAHQRRFRQTRAGSHSSLTTVLPRAYGLVKALLWNRIDIH